jgi:hypothetical protein
MNFNLRSVIYTALLATPLVGIDGAYACSNVSVDGCPAVEEVDDNAAVLTGVWKSSTAKLLWYGDDYEVGAGSGGPVATRTATFTSTVDTEVNGDYSVYARWTTDSNRCTTAVHQIYDGATLIATVPVNQQINGGAWRRLGTYTFTANQYPRVVVTNANCATNRYVVADGIRWVQEDQNKDSIIDEAGVEEASGNQSFTLTTTDAVVRTISVTAPTAGYVLVNASGYWDASSAGFVPRCSITTGAAVDFSYLMIGSLDSSTTNYMPFAGTRGFTVTAGTTTFNLVCNTFAGTGTVGDSSLNGIFTPTRY